eukprot:CAMPEP_0184311586 /NCGR_PEP_ID=MMETSP1049-20130417/42847_1 /TAXON_ID=77928 /ORGANISM="Proteomonas sulcata, Strain CCMP704" /LENGTH=71 /DNA_ID=CAMNT_0026627093 /DNA_START=162 /DNA_END=374 /DNA_ORIENTATION=-
MSSDKGELQLELRWRVDEAGLQESGEEGEERGKEAEENQGKGDKEWQSNGKPGDAREGNLSNSTEGPSPGR